MKSVKVDKEWLKGVVAKNRDKHREEYETAFEGYRRACIEALEKNLAALRAGKRERIILNEHAPEDHTKDYSRVISMLDASVDKYIELAAEEYQQYVEDDWSWREMWTFSNSRYLGQ